MSLEYKAFQLGKDKSEWVQDVEWAIARLSNTPVKIRTGITDEGCIEVMKKAFPQAEFEFVPSMGTQYWFGFP